MKKLWQLIEAYARAREQLWFIEDQGLPHELPPATRKVKRTRRKLEKFLAENAIVRDV